jgi:hypothetical protein
MPTKSLKRKRKKFSKSKSTRKELRKYMQEELSQEPQDMKAQTHSKNKYPIKHFQKLSKRIYLCQYYRKKKSKQS